MRYVPTNSAWAASITRTAERDEQRRTNPMTTASDTKAIRLPNGRIIVAVPVACDIPNVTIANVETIDGKDMSNEEWEQYCQQVVEGKRRPPAHALYRGKELGHDDSNEQTRRATIFG